MRIFMILQSAILFVQVLFLCFAFSSFANYGIAINGSLKYKDGFKQFQYTSENARKGGKVTLHDIGSFDKLNPFTLKGESPLEMETLLFEPLMASSFDEPFSVYGLLAKDIEIARDKKSVIFTLDPQAHFSDGSEVTAEDVAYTLALLKSSKVHPHYQSYYKDITGSEILGKKKIRFLFSVVNRELPLIAGQIRVLPKKFHIRNGFDEESSLNISDFPIGSGPYIVSHVALGKSIIYQRNKNYWAKDLPTRKGMYNFDQITVKYYKDQVIALEAFKAGEFDFISINIAKQWARDIKGPKFTDGLFIKKTFPHHNSAGIQGFVMNSRRMLFKDRRVREAMGLALDFNWINRSLFFNQYTRNRSFFSNSPLAAKGLPSTLELQYLLPFKDILPKEVFTTALSVPTTPKKHGIRTNLRKAKRLLDEAGWHIKEGVLVNEKGEPFQFAITLVSHSFERVMASYVKNLKKLGIQASYRTIDQALYVEKIKKFDFDMIVTSYGQSQSPGNEQRNYWTSASAEIPGSRNYAGIHSAAVDNLVDKIIYAQKKEELVAACRALDRVLWYGYYLVPNWYLPYYRLSYKNIFTMPEKSPLYYYPFQLLMTWWSDN